MWHAKEPSLLNDHLCQACVACYSKHFTDTRINMSLNFSSGTKTTNHKINTSISQCVPPNLSPFDEKACHTIHISTLHLIYRCYIPKKKKIFTHNAWRTMYDNVRKPIATGHLDDSCNLMTYIFCRSLFKKPVCSHCTCILDKPLTGIHRQHNMYRQSNFYYFQGRISFAQVGVLFVANC